VLFRHVGGAVAGSQQLCVSICTLGRVKQISV
jgi:hypothetical protein